MPKNPFYADKVVLKDGGVIETSDGTAIIEVDENGVPSIKADISEALAYGSIYVGDSAGVTSELALGASGYILTSNGTTAVWAAGGVPTGTTITATNDTATGAVLNMAHDSASPAEGDLIGMIVGQGNDDGGDPFTYASFGAAIGDPSDGSEEGSFAVFCAKGGVFSTAGDPDFIVGPGTIEIAYTDDGTTGAQIRTYHVSTTPAIDDAVSLFVASGYNDAAGELEYGTAGFVILNPAQGAEVAGWGISLQNGSGSLQTTPQLSLLGATAGLTLTSEQSGAEGASLVLYQDSASPAANDAIGMVKFLGEDNASGFKEYAQLWGQIDDPTAGAEFGSISFKMMNGTGSLATAANISHDGARAELAIGDGTAGPALLKNAGTGPLLLDAGDTGAGIALEEGASGDVVLLPGASGTVKFGTHSALGGETVSGFITITDAGGTSRKVAIVT